MLIKNLIFLILISTVSAYFGDHFNEKEQFNKKISIVEQGLSKNLAYLLAFSDLIVVADYKEDDQVNLIRIEKVIHNPSNLKLNVGDVIYYDHENIAYTDNSREMKGPRNVDEERYITYKAPLGPKTLRRMLLFLREAQVTKEYVKEYISEENEEIPVFRVTNGGEGQILLDKSKVFSNGELELALKIDEIRMNDLKVNWGVSDGKEFLEFIEKFHSDKLQDNDSLLYERLRQDSLHLIKSLADSNIKK